MSTAYAGVNTFPTTIPIPSDGDTKPAASVGAALQGLKDATIYLANMHLGVNPAGTFKNPTLRGNITINNITTDRALSIANMAITLDGLCELTIGGPAGSSPTLTVNRNVNWPTGNHTFGGGSGQTVSFSCPTFISQPMSVSGQGRIRRRRQATVAGNFDRTISAGTTDVYIVRASDIASGNKGIVQNGTADGSNVSFDAIRIVSFDNSIPFPLYRQDGVTALEDNNGAPIVLRANPSGSGEYAAVDLLWNGTTWEKIG